ncbi:hypothetical protein KP509_03G062300 [Ceratopteris richardii]|uniref:F-box domain-containing protein n=1 Tax=Ceratopteris richardii TaxID=49495 RepID=A0A8T2V400_CERRI|nr:hypothetical protein KP509_03G062300 [Ceratopteris richardii]KAH7441921.1 hypothetical protein KP509_03G062300 [Ceratopteris richardii]
MCAFPLSNVNPSPPLVDPFELLPDSLVLHIFNRVHDVKALGRCFAVCKRFHSLVAQVEDIVVKVDCVISTDESNLSLRGKGLFIHLCKALVGSLVKPLHALQHFLAPKKHIFPDVSHHSPGEVLKNFEAVRRLRIELPGGELGVEDGIILKWRAEFGSSLENCVILAASSLMNSDKEESIVDGGSSSLESVSGIDDNQVCIQDNGGNIPEAFFTNGGLKLRVVWTISSLIAASARHYLLQQIVADHPTLECLTLADADGQGTLCMNKQQLLDFQGKPIAASAATNRTQVPALSIKLWYAPMLDLPGGMSMKGATLVAIRPSHLLEGSESLPMNVFEEPFCKAAGLLARRRTYLLEMNSF